MKTVLRKQDISCGRIFEIGDIKRTVKEIHLDDGYLRGKCRIVGFDVEVVANADDDEEDLLWHPDAFYCRYTGKLVVSC